MHNTLVATPSTLGFAKTLATVSVIVSCAIRAARRIFGQKLNCQLNFHDMGVCVKHALGDASLCCQRHGAPFGVHVGHFGRM